MLENLYNNPRKSAFTLIFIMAIFSAVYNAFLPLHGDEAYYWMWSHHLQTGYYDHPPMIAFMIYFTNFISESEWGVRLVNVFSFSISAIYIFKLTREISDDRTALNAVIIFLSVIIVNAGFIITTTDSPIILFWTLSLYYSYRAIFYGSLKDYILTGLMIGFMMLSKYTAIILVFSILIFILIKRRDILLNIKFYLALIIAFIVVSPMLWWNYQNEWISFLFQLGHGSSKTYELSFNTFFEYIGSQFGLLSPIFAAILFYYLIKDKLYYKEDKLFFISLSVALTLGFFGYKSLFKSMGVNFAAPAYIGGVIILAYIVSKYELRKTFKAGLLVALFFTIIARYMMMFHLDIIREEMYNPQAPIAKFATHIKETDRIYADHLTTAAYLKYYLPNHPDTDLAITSRFSQYDMWRKDDYLQDGLVLTRYRKRDAELKKNFKNVELIDTYVVIPEKRIFYTYRVWEPIKK